MIITWLATNPILSPFRIRLVLAGYIPLFLHCMVGYIPVYPNYIPVVVRYIYISLSNPHLTLLTFILPPFLLLLFPFTIVNRYVC